MLNEVGVYFILLMLLSYVYLIDILLPIIFVFCLSVVSSKGSVLMFARFGRLSLLSVFCCSFFPVVALSFLFELVLAWLRSVHIVEQSLGIMLAWMQSISVQTNPKETFPCSCRPKVSGFKLDLMFSKILSRFQEFSGSAKAFHQ